MENIVLGIFHYVIFQEESRHSFGFFLLTFLYPYGPLPLIFKLINPLSSSTKSVDRKQSPTISNPFLS